VTHHSSQRQHRPKVPASRTLDTCRSISKDLLDRSGGPSGMVVASVPTVVFVVVNGLAGLYPALLTTVAVALLAFGWRVSRREPPRQAVIGLLIAAACATVAVLTGEARGFFVVPIAIPLVAVACSIGSLLLRRPLAGLLLNRFCGGPPGWRADRPLVRIYSWSTAVCIVVNVANFAVQLALFLADETAWLAVAHVVTPVLFGVVMVATIVLARRAMAGRPARSGPPSPGPGEQPFGY
jgi:hypothetical protein